MWMSLTKEEVTMLEALADGSAGEGLAALGKRIIDWRTEQESPEAKQYQELAEENQTAGECEVDSDAIVSFSENGAYVMAWVWVDDPEANDEESEGPNG